MSLYLSSYSTPEVSSHESMVWCTGWNHLTTLGSRHGPVECHVEHSHVTLIARHSFPFKSSPAHEAKDNYEKQKMYKKMRVSTAVPHVVNFRVRFKVFWSHQHRIAHEQDKVGRLPARS